MDDADGRLMGAYGASITSPVAEAIWLSPEVADASLPVGGDDGVGGYAPLAVVTGSGSSLAVNCTAITWAYRSSPPTPAAARAQLRMRQTG